MNNLLKEDVMMISTLDLPWEKLKNKSVLISGGAGLIGSFLVDVLMYQNQNINLNCSINVVGRNVENTQKRFNNYWQDSKFNFIKQDINNKIECRDLGKIDFIIHLASNTHPIAYATRPIETIATNIIGTKNLLDFAVENNIQRFVFASSCEIYGENRGDEEFFNEEYCGYINCNTMRAGYPESKRCGESLCQAYIQQKGLDIVIPRFSRTYGSTLLEDDSKALSQFIKKGIAKEDIVLKSEGKQFYSYTYVADAVSGLLYVLFYGRNGEAYNIADSLGDLTLRELADVIAKEVGTRVIFELPDSLEKSGYSKATKSRLNGDKLKKLGWKMNYSIQDGIKRTLNILK